MACYGLQTAPRERQPPRSTPMISHRLSNRHGSDPAAPGDRAACRCVLWITDGDPAELVLAREAVARLPGCAVTATKPAATVAFSRWLRDDVAPPARPDVVVLASDRPGRWSSGEALALSLRWPLVPILAVSSSLADGRRRSGPPLPGVEEIPWHDAAGRLARWFSDLDAGLPGSLGQPRTARREERLQEAPSFAPGATPADPLPAVEVAARRPLDLEGIAELLLAVGHPVTRRTVGRPDLDGGASSVVWDACRLDGADLEWLRMLVANRPGTAIVVLESFPRGDAALAALRAGAAAILGRPVGLEALCGTLVGLAAGRAGR